MPDIFQRGFEITDGCYNFIVVDVHADTVETFDGEGVRDLMSHEEWSEAVSEILKEGGEVCDEPLADRLALWVQYQPNFPIWRV